MVSLHRPLPNAILEHIIQRTEECAIKYDSLLILAQWVDGNPELPESKWCVRFPGFTLAGEGGLVKTILPTEAACEGEVIVP